MTLEDCMQKQKQIFPYLEVPRIFIHLRDAFYQLDGPGTEGVFRVPANTNEVNQLKDIIDRGKYNILTVATSVHAVAAIMKLWFRELADPIIPNNL